MRLISRAPQRLVAFPSPAGPVGRKVANNIDHFVCNTLGLTFFEPTGVSVTLECSADAKETTRV